MSYVGMWARAFAFTAAIEIVVAALLFALLLRVGLDKDAAPGSTERRPFARWARLIGLLFFANLASHPAVWFVFPSLDLSYPAMVAWAETWAVASEAIFYWLVFSDVGLGRAVGVSLVANGSSFGLGLVVRSLTGWF